MIALDNETTIANDKMQMVLTELQTIMASDLDRMTKGWHMARAKLALQQLFSDKMVSLLKALEGSENGFKTDKPYSIADLKDALLNGMLQGAYPVNNEINVIAGKAYLTKSFFSRALFELPGLTDLRIQFGNVQTATGGALVEAIATWNYHGRADSIECVKTEKLDGRIPVKLNAGMGVDGAIGKAERKLKYQIYKRVTGCTFTDADEVAPDESTKSV